MSHSSPPPTVISRTGIGSKIKRQGRGFSPDELSEVGLDLRKARRLGLKTDPNRKTKYPENVQALKEWIQKNRLVQEKAGETI